jgi:hypothetical protein
MAVNWIGLIGENTQMISPEEITEHSLTHNPSEGYGASNLPKEKYVKSWQKIFFQGGELQKHWKSVEQMENLSYIFAPFCGDYIFIYSEKKQSGGRKATLMHSQICKNGDYLAEQCTKIMGGMTFPSSQDISNSINEDHIKIPSSKSSGIGLSSWLFLNKEIKSSIGVSSGVPVNLLQIIFPDVSSWLIEDESETVSQSNMMQESSLFKLVMNHPEPKPALDNFLMLEVISQVFEIDKEQLIKLFLKDNGAETEINSSVETELRIILGDRNGALDLVINDNKLLSRWMNQPKVKYNEVLFPFTTTELSVITDKINSDKFTFFKSCFDFMEDYPAESKIKMAKILTRYGSQEILEQIWGGIDSSHQDLTNENFDEIFLWRKNPNIDNFWKIIEVIEGSNIHVENNSKRLLLEKIISNSVISSDLIGIMYYVPDMLRDKNQYEFDWMIMTKIESNYNKILYEINEIYTSPTSIQERILLYIDKKLPVDKSWKIQTLIPFTKRDLILDEKWMRPLLNKLKVRKRIYSIQMPSDGYDWITSLSPSQYLEALDDSVLRIYLLDENIMRRISLPEWSNPKAMGNPLTNDLSASKKRQEWAKLCTDPSVLQRIRFHQYKIRYGFSLILFVITLSSLTNIVILINEYESFETYFNLFPLSIFGFAVILQHQIQGRNSDNILSKKIRPVILIIFIIICIFLLYTFHLNHGFTLDLEQALSYANFNGYSIPLLNNLLLVSFLVIAFWQFQCYFFRSAREKIIEKSDYIINLKK